MGPQYPRGGWNFTPSPPPGCATDAGKCLPTGMEFLDIFTEHFTAKYTSTENMLKSEEYLHGLTLTKLSYKQKQQLDMPLSLQELTSAIMNMGKNLQVLMDLPLLL